MNFLGSKRFTKYKVGEAVVVNEGVMCPDFEGLSIAGWQVFLIEVYSKDKNVQLHWDTQTLRNISAEYIEDSEHSDLDFSEMILDMTDISKTEPRGSHDDAKMPARRFVCSINGTSAPKPIREIAKLMIPLGNADEKTCFET